MMALAASSAGKEASSLVKAGVLQQGNEDGTRDVQTGRDYIALLSKVDCHVGQVRGSCSMQYVNRCELIDA